jgi:hypothetical protein
MEFARFIPARAGNATTLSATTASGTVHPRARRERASSVAATGELEQVPDELRLDRRRTALQFRRVVLAQCLAVDADDVCDLVLRRALAARRSWFGRSRRDSARAWMTRGKRADCFRVRLRR